MEKKFSLDCGSGTRQVSRFAATGSLEVLPTGLKARKKKKKKKIADKKRFDCF